MVNGFVLVLTKIGKEGEVLEALRNLEHVEDAWEVYGDYDLLVKVKGSDIADIEEAALTKIREMTGVTKTVTMLVVR